MKITVLKSGEINIKETLLSLKSDQLITGMLLGQDIESENGVLLMPYRKCLNDADIYWLNETFHGQEVLVIEPRLNPNSMVEYNDVEVGVRNSLLGIDSIESMYKLMSVLNYHLGPYFVKLFPQLLDLRKTDPITFSHSIHVAWYTLLLSYKARVERADKLNLLQAAVLHDIGKSFISKTLLSKSEKLTKEEFDIIKKHSEYGERWITPLVAEGVSTLVRQHHEYPNSEGYPDGLSGEQIDNLTRYITISDIFDAICCKRVYKDERDPFEAFLILKKETQAGRVTEDAFLLFRYILDMLHNVRVKLTNNKEALFIRTLTASDCQVSIRGKVSTISISEINNIIK